MLARIDVTFAVAAVALGGWIALAVSRGRFWAVELERHHDVAAYREPSAAVEIVVPARNEGRTVGAAMASLVAQRYGGPLAITLVDDDSSDDTASAARAATAGLAESARFGSVRARRLENPWTGKLNALDAGVAFVRETRGAPKFWLFTDADIEHHPTNLAELVAKAERDGLDLVSLMVRLRCESAWEKSLIPAFVFFFAKLYPFRWSNDLRRSTAAAAGGCVLVRAAALERIGGLDAIADRLIDDCALAAAIKSSGGSTWIGLTRKTASIRGYETLAPLWDMVKRTAFTQLGRSYGTTLLASVAMGLLYLAPPALTFYGIRRADARLTSVATAAWVLMATLYMPTLVAYGRRKREAFLLPFAAALYVAMTLDSAFAHVCGRGGIWKGRVHAQDRCAA